MKNGQKNIYSVDALLKDDFFIRWVLNPDEESNHYWSEMVSDNAQLRKNVGKARDILNVIAYKEKHKLQDDDYQDILNSLIRENRFAKKEKTRVANRNYFLKIAASVLLVAIVSFTLYYENVFYGNATSALNTTEHKHTKKGEKLTVRLPDGSKVKLNSNSSLYYTSGFNDGTREVRLEGEAYFSIKKDPDNPFVIHTGKIKTTVLGTEFNVRSYHDEHSIKVAVVEGKVKVENGDDNYLLLIPNEVSTYKKNSKTLDKSRTDVSNLVAWNKNILVFESATEQEVWKTLENWYGANIEIRNGENIKGRYSGKYVNEPLETVLRGISFASGFDFEIDKNKNVIIK